MPDSTPPAETPSAKPGDVFPLPPFKSENRQFGTCGIREVTRISQTTERAATEFAQASEERASAGPLAGWNSWPSSNDDEWKHSEDVGPSDYFYRVKPDGLEVSCWGDIQPGSALHKADGFLEDEENPFSGSVVPVTLGGKTHRFEVVGRTKWFKVNIRMPKYVAVKGIPRVEENNATFRVRFGSKWCLRHGIEEALPFIYDLAAGLGVNLTHLERGDGTTELKAQISRLDLCVDLPRRLGSRAADCMRGYATRSSSPWQYRDGSGWTGLHNKTSKGVKVRIYDKRREVYSGANGDMEHYKAAFEHYGVLAYPHIWRVEFSLPRKRLRRGLVQRDEQGNELRTIELEKLTSLTRQNLDYTWRAMAGAPGQTKKCFFWLSEESKEEQRRSSRSTPDSFWRYVRRSTIGDRGSEGWFSGPEKHDGGDPGHLMKIGKGVTSTAIARAGIEEYGSEVEKCIHRMEDLAEEEAPAKFTALLLDRLDTLLDARGFEGDERERWRKTVEDGVLSKLSKRASQPFWFAPLLDGNGEEEERNRLRHDPYTSPLNSTS